MRSIFSLSIFVLVLAFAAALPASAQVKCHGDEANTLYKRFIANYKQQTAAAQKDANEAATAYLAKFGACTDEGDKKIAAFMRNWVAEYEDALLDTSCRDTVNNTPKDAFATCAPFVAKHSDDPTPQLLLLVAGIRLASQGDRSFVPQTVAAGRSALDLINSGKVPGSFVIFADKAEAVAGINYYVAGLIYQTSPKDAVSSLVQAARSGTKFSKEPSVYQYLGASYYDGEFGPLSSQYKTQCQGKSATPECDKLNANMNSILDRVIDAYARAVALGSKAAPNPAISSVKSNLTAIYKYRHQNSDAGLDELIASILDKPIPDAM